MKKLLPALVVALSLHAVNLSAASADSCVSTSCHAAIGGMNALHQPVKDGDCLTCHQQKGKEHPAKGAKTFELTAKVPALCSQCHDAMGKKKVVHPPVKDGDCLACHNPHGGSGRFLLGVSEDQTDLCIGCHDGAPFKQKVMHGPAAVGACTKCHDPHESNEKKLLRAPARETCLKCHSDFAKSLKEAAIVHPPVKEEPCTSCHNPHGSGLRSLLNKKMPDICVECHDNLEKKLKGVKFPHKPLQQEGGCGNCHSTHFSKARGLLAGDEKTVCLGCHDNDKQSNIPLRNIRKEIEGKKYVHGPIRDGKCSGCHDPHGSNNFRMLTGSYPDTLYAPYREGSYDLCLQCHEKNLLRFADTTIYTKFRNGNRNLHYVHVSDKHKGRSCRICHEPHASNGEKLISKEGYQFGDWKIPIRFQITATGGSCAPGCHRALKYDRENPVIYTK